MSCDVVCVDEYKGFSDVPTVNALEESLKKAKVEYERYEYKGESSSFHHGVNGFRRLEIGDCTHTCVGMEWNGMECRKHGAVTAWIHAAPCSCTCSYAKS